MGTVRHPISCRGFTVRYQWVAEMCQFRRTEADIVGVLMGFTEREHAKNEKTRKVPEGWDWIPLSMSLLAAMTSESVRSVQYALRWLESHGIVSVEDRSGTSGVTKKRAYKLNIELMDKVAETRDRMQCAVSVFLRGECVQVLPATEVQKLQGMVQKLHGGGAKIAS